jgi:hypothetical protein
LPPKPRPVRRATGEGKEGMERPTIVCLCGSTRFKAHFIEANFRETMAGRIVLSVGWFSHADAAVYVPTDDEKRALDTLHLCKVDLADEVLVIQPGHYIGESTRRELDYAIAHGKTVRYWTDEQPAPDAPGSPERDEPGKGGG